MASAYLESACFIRSSIGGFANLGHGRGAELLVALDLGILGFFCHFCKSPNHMMEIYLNRSNYSLTQRRSGSGGFCQFVADLQTT